MAREARASRASVVRTCMTRGAATIEVKGDAGCGMS
jgi:hypothetical protein